MQMGDKILFIKDKTDLLALLCSSSCVIWSQFANAFDLNFSLA